MPHNEICFMDAAEIAAGIRAGELSAKEVMDAVVMQGRLVHGHLQLVDPEAWPDEDKSP